MVVQDRAGHAQTINDNGTSNADLINRRQSISKKQQKRNRQTNERTNERTKGRTNTHYTSFNCKLSEKQINFRTNPNHEMCALKTLLN